MEIITTTTTTTTATNTTTTASTAKSPEPDNETPTRIQQTAANANPNANAKPLSFSNGVLKRHHPPNHHAPPPSQPVTVSYKECLKNHVASLGGHALDGCGEFMPSPNATENDPSSIKCAACGCHRNFHRREPEEPPVPIAAAHHVFEYQPHHRHHPPPPPPFQNRSPNSASPPPISSYPSAPHMLLALSGSGALPIAPENTAAPTPGSSASRKRFRTKFTQGQKEKMLEFAERVGWKMQKRDDDLVMEFCNEVGVDRGVLKVWMHNNKNTFGKRDHAAANGGAGDGVAGADGERAALNGNGNGNGASGSQDPNQYENDSGTNGATNGSSSSS